MLRRVDVRLAVRFLAVAIVAISLHGCGWSQSPRARAAEEAAETLSAAAATLDAVHRGRMTRQYAASSFQAFAEQGTQALREVRSFGLDGGSRAALEKVTSVLTQPCLDAGCDWQDQSEILRATATAMLNDAGR